MLRTYVQTGRRTEEDKTTLCAIQIRRWMLPPCLLPGSPLHAGYRLHLLSIHSPSSELLLALLRHPDVRLMWRLCWVQILRASPTWVQILGASPTWAQIPGASPTSSTTFPFAAYQSCGDERRAQPCVLNTQIPPATEGAALSLYVTAKANPSINPMFLVLYSLSLTSIYLHSKAPGELSDLKRLESARKDEFPFTTGRLRK